MNKFVLFFMLILMTSVTKAQIYKSTDSRGVIHFSDKPHDGAEKINLPEAQIYSQPALSEELRPVIEEKMVVSKRKYTKIAITQPLHQSTIRNNQGAISVSARLEPALSSGDKAQLILDGSPFGDPKSNLNFNLTGINRGSHRITIQIINLNNEVLITSKSITIYMHRPRVGMVLPGVFK